MTMADLLIVCWSPCVVWQRTQHFVGNDTKMTRTEKPWLLAFVGFTDGWNYSHYIHLCSFQIQPDFDKNSELPSQNMGVAGLLQPQSVRLFGVLMYKYTFNRSEWSLRTCSQHKPSEGNLSLPVTELVSAAVWPQSPPGGLLRALQAGAVSLPVHVLLGDSVHSRCIFAYWRKLL